MGIVNRVPIIAYWVIPIVITSILLVVLYKRKWRKEFISTFSSFALLSFLLHVIIILIFNLRAEELTYNLLYFFPSIVFESFVRTFLFLPAPEFVLLLPLSLVNGLVMGVLRLLLSAIYKGHSKRREAIILISVYVVYQIIVYTLMPTIFSFMM
ncbi:hypothetical protein [Evansella cellulosilytica]|uniref:hypothetical protein n=1 Tax=Evansella cellulosilytica TaxID=1413 RepID=UPI00031FF19B|nr:hypothetical protein [Evansella cellulosilytica]